MTASTLYPRLLADIGGTHARLAWKTAPDAALTCAESHLCADHAHPLAVIEHHLKTHALPAPRAMAIGIATAVTGDRVAMTNHHWSFGISSLRSELRLDRLVVLNDFAALAHALPHLPAAALHAVGGGPGSGSARAVIGPGTGLGVAGLVQADEGRWIVIEGEGGHATLAAQTREEWALIERLGEAFGHVSAERILSGPGLVALYRALCGVRALPARDLTAADVTGEADSDPLCADTVDIFLGFLGSVAGNVALTLGARSGVYIGGGIVPRLLRRLRTSPFRSRFEGKGRFASYLAPIPIWVINSGFPAALIGADAALDRLG